MTSYYVPGTVLGSGNVRMKRHNLCFHGAYSLIVETDMQKKFTIQYNKVLPRRYLQCAEGTWKGEKEHQPGEIRDNFTEEVAIELRLYQ